MLWIAMHQRANPELHLGFIPSFLSEDDPRSAREQFDTNYLGGSGWRPFEGFEMLQDGALRYPGDPDQPLMYETRLRDETIRVYDHAWVAIVQPDGKYEIARLD
jgi:hypothetical protein